MRIEKPSVSLNIPSGVDIDVDRSRQQVNRFIQPPATTVQTKQNPVSEYQSRYKPIIDQKKPRTRKAFEAEQAEERVKIFSKDSSFLINFLFL